MMMHTILIGGMEKKIRENAVYISLLPEDTTEEKLAEHFGSIGVIKVPSINQLLFSSIEKLKRFS